MEQRNEMLRNMRLTERQKKGDVQHLLSRSFSQRGFSGLQSPPADISIPVPQFPVHETIDEKRTTSAAKPPVYKTMKEGLSTSATSPAKDSTKDAINIGKQL